MNEKIFLIILGLVPVLSIFLLVSAISADEISIELGGGRVFQSPEEPYRFRNAHDNIKYSDSEKIYKFFDTLPMDERRSRDFFGILKYSKLIHGIKLYIVGEGLGGSGQFHADRPEITDPGNNRDPMIVPLFAQSSHFVSNYRERYLGELGLELKLPGKALRFSFGMGRMSVIEKSNYDWGSITVGNGNNDTLIPPLENPNANKINDLIYNTHIMKSKGRGEFASGGILYKITQKSNINYFYRSAPEISGNFQKTNARFRTIGSSYGIVNSWENEFNFAKSKSRLNYSSHTGEFSYDLEKEFRWKLKYVLENQKRIYSDYNNIFTVSNSYLRRRNDVIDDRFFFKIFPTDIQYQKEKAFFESERESISRKILVSLEFVFDFSRDCNRKNEFTCP